VIEPGAPRGWFGRLIHALEGPKGVILVAGVFALLLALFIQGVLPAMLPETRRETVTRVVRTSLGDLQWVHAKAQPYTPLELLGRRVYQREGCWYCHSQYIRPINDEELRWGPVTEAGEYAFDVPHFWGTQRIGPDLARVGLKVANGWHYAHHWDPRVVVPASNMPALRWLFRSPVTVDISDKLIVGLVCRHVEYLATFPSILRIVRAFPPEETISAKSCSYSGFNRERWQRPHQVVEALGLQPGDHVADLGSGGGYFTLKLARTVGPDGRVYAVDTDTDMLPLVAQRAREGELDNVVTVQAGTDDPGLPEPVDLMLVVDAFHHLPDHDAYLRSLAGHVRPGGRVAVIEPVPRWWLFGHATAPEALRDAFAEAGLTIEAEHDFLPRQAFLIGRRHP
jgi:cbb3-type cytochrome oxidase cytochrome c subunit/SAM-dependent methyltransferase